MTLANSTRYYKAKGLDYRGDPFTFYTLSVFKEDQNDPTGYARHVAKTFKGLGEPQKISVKRIAPKRYFDDQYGEGYYKDVINPGLRRMERMNEQFPTAKRRMEKK